MTIVFNTTTLSANTALSNNDQKKSRISSVLFVQNYQGTGGTENISKMLLEQNTSPNGAHLQCSNATLLDFSIKGTGNKFQIVNHVTEVGNSGEQRTTTEAINWNKSTNFSDIQNNSGSHIGRGQFGLKIEKICLKNYFLNLGHKTIETNTKTNNQENTNKLDGILIKTKHGFELNPTALENMKAAIEDAAPQVVYVAQDHAVTLVSEAVKELNITRPAGEKIGVAYGIHREDLAVNDSDTNEKSYCVAHNMSASYDAIQVAVVCSRSAGQNYLDVGGNSKVMMEVENGTDCEKFSFNPAARQQFREENNIPQNASVVTLAGRYSPEKDVTAYIKIIGEMLKQSENENLHFIGCGSMISNDNIRLQALIKNSFGNEYDTLKKRIHFLGFQDMPTVMSATDVILSTSRTESWGLTLLEAAAAGCIAVYPELPGTCNAMGDLANTYNLSVKREETEEIDPLFPQTKSLSNESIAVFVSKLQKALILSENQEAKERHVERARETDVSKMYNGYLTAFELAHQRANSNEG
jgi:glycosyltransferase involved in cell wall biosynthesis